MSKVTVYKARVVGGELCGAVFSFAPIHEVEVGSFRNAMKLVPDGEVSVTSLQDLTLVHAEGSTRVEMARGEPLIDPAALVEMAFRNERGLSLNGKHFNY